MIRTKVSALAIAVVLVIALGCSGEGKYVPVSGQVLVDGKPRKGLVVMFQPVGNEANPNPGKGSAGRTDAEGRFTLSVDDDTSGAVAGKHKVAIFTALSDDQLRIDPEIGSEDGAPAGPVETIPPKYNDMSELTFEVPEEGTDQAKFDLKTK